MSDQPAPPSARRPAILSFVVGWSVGPLFGLFMALSIALENIVPQQAIEIGLFAVLGIDVLLSLVAVVAALVAMVRGAKSTDVLAIVLALGGLAPVLLFWVGMGVLMMLSNTYF